MKSFTHLSLKHLEHYFEPYTETAPDGSRYYVIPEGYRYPSVTTVLEPLHREDIQKWRQKVGEKQADFISKRATDRGTPLHEMIEKYLKNESISKLVFQYPMHIVGLFQSIKPMLDANLDNIHIQELALFSRILEVAGRVDCIAEWNHELAVIDFKGSTKEKKEEWINHYFMQTSAYAFMYWERFGILPKKIVIVVSSETGGPQVFVKKSKDYIEAFKEQVRKFNAKS